jgi:hypothetical protein
LLPSFNRSAEDIPRMRGTHHTALKPPSFSEPERERMRARLQQQRLTRVSLPEAERRPFFTDSSDEDPPPTSTYGRLIVPEDLEL